ncbi:MAG: ATP-dependent helicase, partial [bacterium]|nr:ATP-dependent helicase [bacterium]
GWHVVRYEKWRAAVAASRPRGVRRSLINPNAKLLATFSRHDRVAVLDVPCDAVDDLRLVHGTLAAPAHRRGCRLLIHAHRSLESLAPEAFVDPEWRHPWTLERLRWLAGQPAAVDRLDADAPDAPDAHGPRWLSRLADRARGRQGERRDRRPPPRPLSLDPQQCRAVRAGTGVVQVIAPAGSGKTSVLVERVKELLHRGAAPERILCSTFNRDAKLEIAARLERAGVAGVAVRSFHGLGLALLKQEGRTRAGIGEVDDDTWQRLAERARDAEADGVALDVTAARNVVSGFKLSAMVDPPAALAQATGGDARARTAARLYDLYQRHLDERGRLDFDDLIAGAVALLQRDAEVRRRWQARFDHVLVDEYQDIEPAQALLVGLLAAPQDSLFCVGDEDQCIYAWRRASVERVIELDQVYPDLERHPLIRNYRCGRRITVASRRLIRHNRRRFRKPLRPGAPHRGRIRVHALIDRAAGAQLVVALVREVAPGRDGAPGTTAVLARTSALLREVARAGADAGVALDGACELATIHAAKGREWDRVILYGVDRGQIPHSHAVSDDGGLESERRLFYVALTRARHRLEIVCSKKSPSRFLAEAGLRA